MKKTKTAFITFFPTIPDNMGSSTVVNSRFKSWPSKKKLFQLSHIKKINNKNTKTINIIITKINMFRISVLKKFKKKNNYY